MDKRRKKKKVMGFASFREVMDISQIKHKIIYKEKPAETWTCDSGCYHNVGQKCDCGCHKK